jgi:hypothetical protein
MVEMVQQIQLQDHQLLTQVEAEEELIQFVYLLLEQVEQVVVVMEHLMELHPQLEELLILEVVVEVDLIQLEHRMEVQAVRV